MPPPSPIDRSWAQALITPPTDAIDSETRLASSPAARKGARQPQTASRPTWASTDWDIVIVGGGNAAVTAALAADDLGARVLVLESAPSALRGGNTRHTRNIRCVHGVDAYNAGAYSYDELWSDLCNVGTGPSDEGLAAFTVRASESVPAWMAAHGARWQQPLAGTLHLGRTNRFFLGGGKSLLNAYYRTIHARQRIQVAYGARVEEFSLDGPLVRGVIVSYGGGLHRVTTRTLICASGGFEANLDWLRRYWGSAANNFLVRGTPYNDGHVLSQLYAAGASPAGEERGFHAIAIDARSPRFDGGIATRLDTIPFGVVVNKYGRRFYDEGEETWPKRYATWGRRIAEQDGQIAYSIWDRKVNALFLPPMYRPATADNISDLASQLALDPIPVCATIEAYNRAVIDGTFDASRLDDCRTVGVSPPKSHWAQRIDTPAFYGVAMRPGITFTYRGVQVAADGRVRLQDGSTLENVYAAGEIMSGNILSTGYLAGFGMTIGTVWGRLTGSEAAKRVFA